MCIRTLNVDRHRIKMSVGAVHGCYLSNWAVYRPAPHNIDADKIPTGLCTHIFYAFAAVNAATFQAKLTDDWADVGLKGIEKVNNYKKRSPGAKSLLSFGGATESDTGIYATLSSDPSKINTFVTSAWALANQYGFDGIDLDWEYPVAASKANFVALVKALKAKSGGKLVTAAVTGAPPRIDLGYDVLSFASSLDYITVMAYDFHGIWDGKIGHQADYPDTIKAMQYWNQKGMPKTKILMGIGAYGRGWIANSCTPGAATNNASPALPVTQQAGYAAFFEIDAMSGTTTQTSDGPYKLVTVNGQKVCYGFDDRNAVIKKMQYVKANGYGGAFTWTVDFDNAAFTIHTAMKDGLQGAAPKPAPAPGGNKKSPAPAPKPAPAPAPKPAPAPAPAPSSGKCTDGQMRGNANPKKYEQCLYGKWVVRDCPGGTVWDNATKNFKVGRR